MDLKSVEFILLGLILGMVIGLTLSMKDHTKDTVKMMAKLDTIATNTDNTRREWKDIQAALIKKGIIPGE